MWVRLLGESVINKNALNLVQYKLTTLTIENCEKTKTIKRKLEALKNEAATNETCWGDEGAWIYRDDDRGRIEPQAWRCWARVKHSVSSFKTIQVTAVRGYSERIETITKHNSITRSILVSSTTHLSLSAFRQFVERNMRENPSHFDGLPSLFDLMYGSDEDMEWFSISFDRPGCICRVLEYVLFEQRKVRMSTRKYIFDEENPSSRMYGAGVQWLVRQDYVLSVRPPKPRTIYTQKSLVFVQRNATFAKGDWTQVFDVVRSCKCDEGLEKSVKEFLACDEKENRGVFGLLSGSVRALMPIVTMRSRKLSLSLLKKLRNSVYTEDRIFNIENYFIIRLSLFADEKRWLATPSPSLCKLLICVAIAKTLAPVNSCGLHFSCLRHHLLP